MSHVVLRVNYSDSSDQSLFTSQPQHFVIVGGGRDKLSSWVLSLTGNVLHHETARDVDTTPLDFLTSDNDGRYVASFERKQIVIRDVGLNICNVFRLSKEIPSDGEFIFTKDTDDGISRPCYFICCFESGLVAVSIIVS